MIGMQYRQDMPSRPALGSVGRLYAFLLASVVGLVTGLGFWFFLPDPREGRELPLAMAAQSALARATAPSSPLRPSAVSYAEQFCRQVAGVGREQADCRLGRALSVDPARLADSRVAPGDRAAIVRAQTWLAEKAQGYAAIRDTLSPVLQGSDRSWLIAGVELRLARLLTSANALDATYADVFDALLAAEGLRYDSSSGSFALQRWDVARLLERPDEIRARAERLLDILQWLPLAAGLAVFAVIFVVIRALGWSAAMATTCFSLIISLGLLVVADASLRFGQGASIYLLNPFSYALERQVWVVALMALLPIVGLLAAQLAGPWFSSLMGGLRRWLALVVVATMAATTALYSLLGPAAGSEALKLSVCLFAGLITAGYARQTFLARKVMPDIFSLRALAASLAEFIDFSAVPTARRVIHASLIRAYLGLLLLGLGTMAAAALVFSDFGGTLVSAVVFTALIFILFGLRLSVVFLAAGASVAALALLTDKVQARVQLMLDPMTASVSDFARLIKFAQAGQPSGYGLGSVRWCSFEGACLPIQALSDYFPVLLSGALGVAGAVGVFLLLVALYIGLMARAVLGLAAGLGPASMVYSVAFFLLLAALAQTVITYFGNWRLAPLTGLGLPLMSLGWSSMVGVILGLTLLAVAARLRSDLATEGRPS